LIRVLNFTGLELGGMETTIMNYYRHIDRSKIQFDFCFTESSESKEYYYEKEAVSLGANIYRQPLRKMHFLKDFTLLVKILKSNPDIEIVNILGYGASIRAATILLAAKLSGISVRIVYSASDIRSLNSVMHKLLRPFMRLLTTHMTAGSVNAGLSMFGNKAKSKLIIIPRARNLAEFCFNQEKRNATREKLQLKDRYVMIHIGRLTEVKNHIFLLDTFDKAHGINPKSTLLIVGDGEMKAVLEKKISKLNERENVCLLGQRDDVKDLLQAADLFLLPSLLEGLPGAAIEAQSAGLPCLLSDTISQESKITDLVEFLPIDRGTDIWVERMLAYQGFKRRDMSENLKKAGYDINEAAIWLEDFLLECCMRKV